MNLSQIVANGFHKTFTGSDVTITEAKMKACEEFLINGKAVTKRKQEKLWGRYVPCDGITNGNNTSIDTGVKAQDNMEMLVRVKAITGSFYILQSRETSNAKIYGITGSQTNDTIIFFGVTSGITRTSGHIYTIKGTLVNNAVTLYVKDETAGTEDTKTGTLTDYTFPAPTTIKLFGDANKLDAGATVYRAYIKVNGQMAWDMYPCVDVNNSNAPVAYDDVTHAASVKVSGSITAGSLIQPITYAESDGTARADTGIINTQTDKVEVYAACTTDQSGSKYLYGYASDSTRYMLAVASSGNRYLFDLQSGSSGNRVLSNIASTKDVFHKHTIDGKKYYIDDTLIGTSAGDISAAGGTAYLFDVQNRTSGTSTYAEWKIVYCRIWQNNALVRDYLPVRIGTTVELLDLVNWQFATRTGTFTAGADLPYTQLCPDILETNAGDVLYGQWGNLVDFNETRIDNNTWATADKSKGFEIVADIYGKSVGNSLGTNGNCFGGFVPCKKGESVSLNFFNYAPYYGRCFYCEVDANFKVLTTPAQYSNGTSSLTQRTFTATSDDCIGFAIEWYISSAQTRDYTKENYTVLRGTTVPTEYEPYHFGLHPSGEQKVLMCEQGVVTFDGSSDEDWQYDSTYGRFSITVSDAKTGTTRTIQAYAPGWNCLWHAEPISSVQNGDFYVGTMNILFHSRETSVADWKAKLQANPITLFYRRTTDASFIPPQSRTITTFLPSATSFIDAQKASNNVECDWKFKVFDGTETLVNAGVLGNMWSWFTGDTDTSFTDTTVICTHFKTDSSLPPLTNRDGYAVLGKVNNPGEGRPAGKWVGLGIANIASTLEEVQAYLAARKAEGKPVIAVFPVSTPIVTTVEIAPVSLANGTNRVTASSGTVKVTANVRVI